jgi:hypothetical protein
MRALFIIALGKFHSYTAIHIHIILCNHIEHFKRVSFNKNEVFLRLY